MSKTDWEKELKNLKKIIGDKTTSINEMAEQMAASDIEIHRLKKLVRNDEKKIAQAILDAQKMREESYIAGSNEIITGEYKKDIEECLIATCKQQGLSPNLWALLNLAMHWWNDMELWAEDVLAGKNILDECKKENAKMKAEQKAKGEIINEDYEQAIADVKPNFIDRIGEADDDGLEKDT